MIGIIGGIAPFAGLDTVKKIIEETIALKESDHIPVILSSQPNKIPDIYAFCTDQSQENPAKALSEIANQLNNAGVTRLAVTSTLIHSPKIFKSLQELIDENTPGLHLIHMIEEVAKFIIRHHKDVLIGILSSLDIRTENIYKNVFTTYGIPMIESTEEMQIKIQDALYDENFGITYHSSPITHRAHDLIITATEDLKKNGAKLIILANPEMLLALRDTEMFGVPLLDPNRILARSLIEVYDSNKLKPLV